MKHAIEKIQIISANYTPPMHSGYLFESKKVYAESPERTLIGNLVFGEKFFVPYFTISWNYLEIEDFSRLMQVAETDEETVRYFDSFANKYKVAKFAIQQPTYNRLHYKNGEIIGVIGVEMVFDGTLNDISVIRVAFNLNGGSGTVPSTIVGYQGEDVPLPAESNTIVAPNGYKLAKWNTESDGSGRDYVLGGYISLSSNVTLYAQYIPNYNYVLSFDYGVAEPALDENGEQITQKNVVYGASVGTLPTPVFDLIDYDNQSLTEPYTFFGWYTMVNNNGVENPRGTQYTASTIYQVSKNITLHAYIKGDFKTISFASNGGTAVSSISQRYDLPIEEPKKPTRQGYVFEGWYKDNNTFKNKFSFNKMPPIDITLYAKWGKE